MRTSVLASLIIASFLTGCASIPSLPIVAYWDNPQWVNALGSAVNHDVQYPKDAVKQNFPSGTAVVTFVYNNGALENPRILRSTGSSVLDTAILEQIPKIKPPPARGLDTAMPHAFQMEVELYPIDIDLYKAIHIAIADHARYPFDARQRGASGLVLAKFKYRDGQMLDPTILISSGDTRLDKAVINQLATTQLPKPPDWLRNATYTFTVPFCFNLSRSSCLHAQTHMVYIASTSSDVASPPCTVIAFSYEAGKVSDVRITESSNNENFDKQAISEVLSGNFPHPPEKTGDVVSFYNLPVCNTSEPKQEPAASIQP